MVCRAAWRGVARRREAFLKRGLTIDGRKVVGAGRPLGAGRFLGTDYTDYTDNLAGQQGHREATNEAVHAPCNPCLNKNGADKALISFDLFRKQANLDGIDINQHGSRHSSLLAIRMPEFAREHDCQQLIHDFYAKYCDNTKPFSQAVMRINAQAEAESQKQKKLLGANGAVNLNSSASSPDAEED